jgi:hypothetical protein
MTEEFAAPVAPVAVHMGDFVTPAPSMNINPVPQPPRKKKEAPDPDRFLNQAKKIVIDNYNAYRGREKSGPLTMEQVYIISFSKVPWHWWAYVASPVTRGLMWHVSYNGFKEEAIVTCYRQLSNTKISMKESSE